MYKRSCEEQKCQAIDPCIQPVEWRVRGYPCIMGIWLMEIDPCRKYDSLPKTFTCGIKFTLFLDVDLFMENCHGTVFQQHRFPVK